MPMQSDAPDRRQALVEAAYRALAKHGFEGLRMRAVAADAGIDHSTIHHHFATKRDLVAAVVDYATRQFGPKGPPTRRTTLDEHLEMLGRMIAEYPQLHAVLRELDLRAGRDAEVRAIIVEHEKGWRTALAARIREAASMGAWPANIDAAAGAELVIAVVKGASLNLGRATQILHQLRLLVAAPGTARATSGSARPSSRRRRS